MLVSEYHLREILDYIMYLSVSNLNKSLYNIQKSGSNRYVFVWFEIHITKNISITTSVRFLLYKLYLLLFKPPNKKKSKRKWLETVERKSNHYSTAKPARSNDNLFQWNKHSWNMSLVYQDLRIIVPMDQQSLSIGTTPSGVTFILHLTQKVNSYETYFLTKYFLCR